MKFFIAFLFIFSTQVFSDETKYNYAKDLLISEQYTRAVFQFDSLVSTSQTVAEKDQALIGLTNSLWMLGDTTTALKSLNSISDKELSKKLKIALEVHSGNLENISSLKNSQLYLSELKMLESDPYKSPTQAAFYSALLPGAGHIYLGAYQSAAVVFIFNILTGISTIEFAHKNLIAPAITSGVLFSIFYVGGIYSAYEGAVKMNQMKFSEQKKALNSRYFQILIMEF